MDLWKQTRKVRSEKKQAIPTDREEKISSRNYSLSGMSDPITKICHDLSADNHYAQKSTSDDSRGLSLSKCRLSRQIECVSQCFSRCASVTRLYLWFGYCCTCRILEVAPSPDC